MSLTEFTLTFKRFVVYAILATVLYMVGKSTVNFAISYYKSKNPVLPPPPEAKYSRIELPQITSLSIGKESKPVYLLDTKTGKFPVFPARFPVYPLKTQKTTILSEQRARDLALFIGFKMEPDKISTIEFVWDTLQKKMSSNTALGLYSMSFDLNDQPIGVSSSIMPSASEAKIGALDFLKINGLLKPDIENAEVEITPISTKDGKFAVAKGNIIANLARVNFTRTVMVNEIKYPVVTIRKKFPLISLVVGKDDKSKMFVGSFTYTYWEIDLEGGSEYGLNPVDTVWQKIQNGEGSITALYRKNVDEYEKYKPVTVKRFVIKDVSLVYLETPSFNKYLLPYYIFSGEAEYDNGDIGLFDVYHTALTDADIIVK